MEVSFIGGGNQSIWGEKKTTTVLSQVTDNVYHTTLVLMGTDCPGSYKSNYNLLYQLL